MTAHNPVAQPTPDNANIQDQQGAASPTQTPTPSLRGPVRSSERALAPDLARGFMLLLIVLANATWYLWAADFSALSIHPADGSLADRIVQGILITAVDGRSYPMFAFLFGYGMVQLWNRQRAAGASEKEIRALLRRRNLWLLVFGLVHAALLWMGDILGAYGFAGLVLGWLFLRRTNRTLLIWSVIVTGLLVTLTTLSLLSLSSAPAPVAPSNAPEFEGLAWIPTTAVNAEEDYLASITARILPWIFLVIMQGLLTLTLPLAILLGFWAARNRILEEPGNHLRLLRTVAIVGIPLGWIPGLLHALDHVGVLSLSIAASRVLSSISATSGVATGLGYIALFGLIAHRLSRRPTGARSSPR